MFKYQYFWLDTPFSSKWLQFHQLSKKTISQSLLFSPLKRFRKMHYKLFLSRNDSISEVLEIFSGTFFLKARSRYFLHLKSKLFFFEVKKFYRRRINCWSFRPQWKNNSKKIFLYISLGKMFTQCYKLAIFRDFFSVDIKKKFKLTESFSPKTFRLSECPNITQSIPLSIIWAGLISPVKAPFGTL